MDVGTNKTRKDTRAVVSLVARYRSPSTFEYVEEACCDVSLGGMFIRSKDPAAAGTLLKLECESGPGEQIRGVARVVWQRTQQNEYGPSGMGVKFVKLDPESRDVITRIVQELAEAGIEAPSMSSAPEQRGKPKSSSTPAAAATAPASPVPAAPASPPPPPPPKAAELSATRPLSSAPPRNDVAVLHRASDRAPGTPPPPPAGSSKPPAHSGASRPAPSNALLAHAKVEPLEIEPLPSSSGSTLAPLQELGRDLPPPQEMGRDLAPLQAMVRSARVSSPPPPEERSGRAFWLVAGAVVALGAIVALFSLRAAREAAPEEQAGAALVEAPPTTAMDHAAPAPSEAQGAEGASAQVDPANEPGELPAAEQGEPSQLPAAEPSAAEAEQQTPETATAQAAIGHEGSAAPSPITPSPSTGAAQPSAPTAAPASAQTSAPGAPASAPTAAQASAPASAQASAPGATTATQTSAPGATTAAQTSAPAAAQTSAPGATTAAQTSAPAAAQASAPGAPASVPAAAQANVRPSEPSRTPTPTTPSALPPPVVRIVPAEQAPSTTQTTVQPVAAEQSTPAAQAPSQPAAATPAAASSTAESAQKAAPPAELPRVIMFTSRPTGATVTVGDQTVTTPGELNLGNMPPRLRVTAQKEGFESSTIWVNNTTEFQKVGDVMKREVHFVLPRLPQPTP